MITPKHIERQLLQYLARGEWVKATTLPRSDKVISNMLRTGWIEVRGAGSTLAYRITEEGVVAKKAPVRIYR
jgi:hypothetical protein